MANASQRLEPLLQNTELRLIIAMSVKQEGPLLRSNLQGPLSLPCSTCPSRHWHKLQFSDVPRFKEFWVRGRVRDPELSDLSQDYTARSVPPRTPWIPPVSVRS